MKNSLGIMSILIIGILISINLSSCTTNKKVASSEEPTGSQLWAGNCLRCHNMPPPNAYSDADWDAITNHMQKVAGFTTKDINKVAAFLKSANH
jgi:mono/diheme cytochrome c family protein